MKELFINIEDNIKKIYLIEDYNIIEKHEENLQNPMLEGNIYVGKVQNVLPGMQASFINIGSGRNAFIHLRDILPKQDISSKNKEEKQEYDIKKIIKPGEPILVQVTRDRTYKKGARVSKHISITGRFFVFTPTAPFVAVSQKIDDENRKKELKEFFENKLPENMGGIVRTNSRNATETELLDDLNSLFNTWNKIQNSVCDSYPQIVYNAGGILRRYLVDNLDKGLDKIIVSNESLKEEILDFLRIENKIIEVCVDNQYIKKYNFESQLKKLDNRKVWLKCGGFITIDKTEALTAIDVNTGKFIGRDDFEDTVFKVNEEATIEIAKQLRARDIGGIIIIDYIDMHIEENKEKILELLGKELKKDISKVQVEGFTKLNLLEMTRKHVYSV